MSSRPIIPPSALVRATALAAFASVFVLSRAVFAAETAGSDTSGFEQALAHGTAGALLASYAAGVATSLTPCVYPMILITVSIFGAAQSKSRLHAAALSGVFVLGIVALFAPVGVGFAMSGKGLGSALGNPWVIGIISLVFSALAASMFGLFEIALPSSVSTALTGVGGVGYRGAFVLGLVSALVAAPCTGPFLFGLGTWIATQRDLGLGLFAMSSYALGLGTLFFVVGTFAVSLPKAGAWMMGVKWGSGVALACMALAYVRDALPTALVRSVLVPVPTLGIVAGVIAAVGFALAAVHIAAERRKSPIAHLSKPFKLASIAPAILGTFVLTSWLQIPAASACVASEHGCAIAWQTDEVTARALAETSKKPMLIDFGASWCKACHELEDHTFVDGSVVAESGRFVALHVDASDQDEAPVAALLAKYHVVGLPVVLLLDSAGAEVARFTEFVEAAKFLPAMKRVK